MQSLSYIPLNLQEQELYQFICDCIDAVLIEEAENIPLLFQADTDLLDIYTSAEAVNAYYTTCVYPWIGTVTEVAKLLSLYGVSAQVEEWFDYAGTPYHFNINAIVDLDHIDFLVLSGKLTSVIMQYKNERSKLENLNISASLRGNVAFAGAMSIGEFIIVYPEPPFLSPTEFIIIDGGFFGDPPADRFFVGGEF